MSLVIPDEFLQTAHISEADLKLEIAILLNISHGPQPDGCSITALCETSARWVNGVYR